VIKLGIESWRQRRKLAIVVGAAICIAVPLPFFLSWLESLQPKPIKNYTGIPVTWHSVSAIKVRYKKITKIPIKYTRSTRIPIAYRDLSVIKVTYRNGGDTTLTDDPRFPTVRLRNTTFRVAPQFRAN
jgi:hypothetical protein